MLISFLYPYIFGPDSLFSIFPFDHHFTNINKPSLPPFSEGELGTHYFGSDAIGRDVLALLFKAISKSFVTALVACVIALTVSLLLCYFSLVLQFTASRKRLVFIVFIFLAILLFAFYILYFLHISVIGFTFLLCTSLYLFFTWFNWGSPMSFNGDQTLLNMVTILRSLPGLLMLLILVSFIDGISVIGLSFLLALIIWPGYIRLIRGELIKIRALPFIQNAYQNAIPQYRIFLIHMLPNIWRTIFTAFCFGMISLILMETTLSFLGINLHQDAVSLGALINGARTNLNAWWLLIFPGVCLLIILQFFLGIIDRVR